MSVKEASISRASNWASKQWVDVDMDMDRERNNTSIIPIDADQHYLLHAPMQKSKGKGKGKGKAYIKTNSFAHCVFPLRTSCEVNDRRWACTML